ncbi:MAG: head GIN domain-containing protein [Kofleriaceae bacterium]
MRTLICLVLTACTSAAAAPSVSAVRSVEAFHGLDVATVIDVEVAIGPVVRVELRGPTEWVAKISTQVKDGVLRISLPNDSHHVPKLSALITVPELTSVAVSGVAGVHVAKLAAKSFDVAITGVGSVDLAGTADALNVEVSGTGQVMAKELTASTAKLEVAGSGEVTIRATKEVDANVSGVGDVTILGKPTVHEHVSGVAQIHD